MGCDILGYVWFPKHVKIITSENLMPQLIVWESLNKRNFKILITMVDKFLGQQKLPNILNWRVHEINNLNFYFYIKCVHITIGTLKSWNNEIDQYKKFLKLPEYLLIIILINTYVVIRVSLFNTTPLTYFSLYISHWTNKVWVLCCF